MAQQAHRPIINTAARAASTRRKTSTRRLRGSQRRAGSLTSGGRRDMGRQGSVLAAIVTAIVAGCTLGARDIDYSPQRAISDDIYATHQTSPRLLQHGQIEHDEPADAFPWELDSRHQPAR
jgi:hypothetical protein